MKIQRLEVREDALGWMLSNGQRFESVVEAERRVREIGAESAPSILTVEWYPSTRVGRWAVKVVTGVKSARSSGR